MSTAMDPIKKDDIFRNPDMDTLHFGRHLSTLSLNGKIYSAVQMGKGHQTSVLICETDSDGSKKWIHGPSGIIHHPALCAGDGRIYVVWNECGGGGWQIRSGEVNSAAGALKNVETVFSSEQVCHPPSAVFCQGTLYVAFASIYENNLTVYIATMTDRSWTVLAPFKTGGINCFRPQLACGGSQVYLVWDQYKNNKYEVVLAERLTSGWKRVQTLSGENQRWMTPRVVAAPDGTAFLCWVVLQAVTDKLGIIDHHAFIRAARCKDGQVTLLKDENNLDDVYRVGDLREGLLADEIYKGHVGLRRNPQLALDETGTLRLFWEMRKETKGSDVYGHLVGRSLSAEGVWSVPKVFSSSGYCYAVARTLSGNVLPVSCFFFEAKDMDVIRCEPVDLTQGTELIFPDSKWKRWKNVTIVPEAKPSETVALPDGEYKLVWADTHCHSNFSADAEGEPDELIHFARDTSGLDVITVIDNDYYPHKALTDAEWRIHGEMSEHFTKEGQFVWLPGYEFTYHRSDLKPDFNHRCVIYPRKGGKLLRRIDPQTNTDVKMIAELKNAGGMAYPHHCNYELIDPEVEWNIEVCSSWRVCLEETTCTVEKLKQGARVGFIGSSDTHRMVPGLGGARTGLFVKELTPEALFDAYRNRRIIATQGFNLFMDFRVSGAFIGGETETASDSLVKAVIQAPEQIDYVEVIRDGESIWWDCPGSKRFDFEFEDSSAAPGSHFYFMKVKLHGDPSLNVDAIAANNFPKPFEQNSRYPHNLARAKGVFAWSSPVWVKRL